MHNSSTIEIIQDLNEAESLIQQISKTAVKDEADDDIRSV